MSQNKRRTHTIDEIVVLPHGTVLVDTEHKILWEIRYKNGRKELVGYSGALYDKMLRKYVYTNYDR